MHGSGWAALTVAEAGNGRDALLLTRTLTFDLIISDLVMPGLDAQPPTHSPATMPRFLFLSLLAFALAACQTPKTDTTNAASETPARTVADLDADRAELAALSATYEAAVRAGDHATIAALHADDATIQPSDEPAVTGRAGLDAYFEANSSEPRDISFTTVNLVIAESGDMAYEVGTETGPSGQSKYLTVYRRTAEGWKIVADAWNYDAPPTDSN